MKFLTGPTTKLPDINKSLRKIFRLVSRMVSESANQKVTDSILGTYILKIILSKLGSILNRVHPAS